MSFFPRFTPRAEHGLQIIGLALSVMLGACGPARHTPASPKPGPAQSDTRRIGMANPASVYCQQRGGTLEMRRTEQGVTGWCHLPDGTVVEEWSLFRSSHSAPTP
ncbi:DUF333 domain-containing protein [Komagataeibacter sp. FNDCF1]|uniref:putative hemolysin n=1 Tax=Komagataeibacter sp. FNDCF1 TaxID=2878681 RepID=UPI00272DE865|nr:DUF333 domain-containing protein [Komagataeibacter sp. FNDCF1]